MSRLSAKFNLYSPKVGKMVFLKITDLVVVMAHHEENNP
jgi:hypothetical protein